MAKLLNIKKYVSPSRDKYHHIVSSHWQSENISLRHEKQFCKTFFASIDFRDSFFALLNFSILLKVMFAFVIPFVYLSLSLSIDVNCLVCLCCLGVVHKWPHGLTEGGVKDFVTSVLSP